MLIFFVVLISTITAEAKEETNYIDLFVQIERSVLPYANRLASEEKSRDLFYNEAAQWNEFVKRNLAMEATTTEKNSEEQKVEETTIKEVSEEQKVEETTINVVSEEQKEEETATEKVNNIKQIQKELQFFESAAWHQYVNHNIGIEKDNYKTSNEERSAKVPNEELPLPEELKDILSTFVKEKIEKKQVEKVSQLRRHHFYKPIPAPTIILIA